ncbi:MAG: hypothetical protein PF542_01015 [Nanoarchaeota archaeon]|jgi:hypothetical protein|nr:hypothetical protein [Nanoarchaeota archaeon]
MISTIQLSHKVKETLATYRKSPRESYEDIIVNLISEIEKKKMADEALLIEGYKEMAEFDLELCKEFEAIEEDFDWEWK